MCSCYVQAILLANIMEISLYVHCLAVGDQQSLSHGNCQLTNTCFESTTDDWSNEGPTTTNPNHNPNPNLSLSKMTDKQFTPNTETALTVSEKATPLSIRSRVPKHTRDASTEAWPTGSIRTKQGSNATLHTITPISVATNGRLSDSPEVTKISTTVKTTDGMTPNSIING